MNSWQRYVGRDSWKEEISFVNSWKLKNLFVNSWSPAYFLIVVRELTKSRSWNRETCHFSLVREFVKIQNIVREFGNRTLPVYFHISISCMLYRKMFLRSHLSQSTSLKNFRWPEGRFLIKNECIVWIDNQWTINSSWKNRRKCNFLLRIIFEQG